MDAVPREAPLGIAGVDANGENVGRGPGDAVEFEVTEPVPTLSGEADAW